MSLTKLFKDTPQFIIIEAISNAKEKALQKRLLSGYLKHIKENQEKFYNYIKDKSDELNISIYNAINKYFANNLEDLLNAILDSDPTKNKKYANWIIDRVIEMFEVLRGNSTFSIAPAYKKIEEDSSKIKRNLKIFTLLKDRNILTGDKADINKYNFENLFDVVKPYLDDPDFAGTNKEVILNESEIIYDNNGWKIIKPETHRASCFWGGGTNWCTAVDDGDTSTFDMYKEDGDLYIMIREKSKPKRKFQFHWGFETSNVTEIQFMNEEDVEAFDEVWDIVSEQLFYDMFGLVIYDSEKDFNIIEFLYSVDSFCDHVNGKIPYTILWENFIPQEAKDIIIEIYREHVNDPNSLSRYQRSKEILVSMYEDGDDKDNENFLEFAISDIGSSILIDFIKQSENDKFKNDLAESIKKYYEDLRK